MMTDEQKLREDNLAEETCDCPEEECNSINWVEEAEKNKEQYMRAMADMENMRRRFAREKEELIKYASEQLMKELLPVLDNLERALAYMPETVSPEFKTVADGVKMTLDGAWEVLARHGLTAVDATIGCAFDPNFHDAMGQVPNPDVADGSICLETQRGYTLRGRLIRPAQVLVASNPDKLSQ